MSPHEFLSAEWQDAARALRDEYVDRLPEPPFPVRANLVILETPFPEKVIEAHVDTSEGHALPDTGHIADPEMTVTMTYETLRELFLAQDTSVVQMAFMSGQIRVDGDMTRLMFMFDLDPDPETEELGREIEARLREMTA